MPDWHIPNAAVAVLLALAAIAFVAPHLLLLGFKAAGARPPGVLVFLCPLHGPGKQPASANVRLVHATDHRAGSGGPAPGSTA